MSESVLCRKCWITGAVPRGKAHELRDQEFLETNNTERNDVLKQILQHGITEGGRFIILSCRNRYGIKVFKKNKDSAWLTQECLHFDALNKKLFPINIRFVKIDF